jgi:hypothetical protein
LVSNISKNIELLEQYNNYKIFLDSLASNEEKREMIRLREIKLKKIEAKDKKRKEADHFHKQ